MEVNPKEGGRLNATEKLKARALELIDESQAIQFAEAMRLNRAASVVFDRERKRLEKKYGKNDDRAQEMKARADAAVEVKTELFTRYTDAIRPQTIAGKGWAVDGFVRTSRGAGLSGLEVAGYDRSGELVKGYGPVKTDDRGYFSIKVEQLEKGTSDPIFFRASKGSRILTSNEIGLVPTPGETERVEILVGRENPNDPIEPKDDKTHVDPGKTPGKGDETPGRVDPGKTPGKGEDTPGRVDPGKTPGKGDDTPGRVDPGKTPGKGDETPGRVDPGKSPGGERGRTDDPREPKPKK